MYLWIGCKLPEAFSQEIRRYLLSLPGSSAMDLSGFSLPQHISLKISFEAGAKYAQMLNHLSHLLQLQKPFSVHPIGVESLSSILWICFRENTHLQQLHRMLDTELEHRFGIGQHPFDQQFIFHSTLCMGKAEAISALEQQFSSFQFPSELVIDTFLLGISETGDSGSYRVIREISL